MVGRRGCSQSTVVSSYAWFGLVDGSISFTAPVSSMVVLFIVYSTKRRRWRHRFGCVVGGGGGSGGGGGGGGGGRGSGGSSGFKSLGPILILFAIRLHWFTVTVRFFGLLGRGCGGGAGAGGGGGGGGRGGSTRGTSRAAARGSVGTSVVATATIVVSFPV